MNAQRTPVHVTRTLLVPTPKALTSVAANKDLMEMALLVKVC